MARLTESQRQELDSLRRAYAAELPEKLKRIEDAVARLESRGWERQALESLHHMIHRLSGSSAIYGFAAVSEAAGRLEKSLTRALETGVDHAEDARDEITLRARALKRAFALQPLAEGEAASHGHRRHLH